MLAGIGLTFAMAAGAGEAPKGPTIQERIAQLEKNIPIWKARLETLRKKEAEGKRLAPYERSEMEGHIRMIPQREADLAALKREEAANDPKKAAQVAYDEARKLVTILEQQLKDAREDLKLKEAELIKLGGKPAEQAEPK
jgi:chromosome segregation ATPase